MCSSDLASVAKGMHWFPLLETSGLSYEAPAGQSFMDTIVSIFPSNAVQPLARIRARITEKAVVHI